MAKQFCIINLQGGIVQNRKPVTVLFQSLKDGKYLLEISGADKRTNPQNRYYWGQVISLVQEGIKIYGTELSKEETHEFLKARFNYTEIVNEETAEVLQVPISTTKLNKSEFSQYIDKIQQFAAEWLRVVIPDAGEQQTIDYD